MDVLTAYINMSDRKMQACLSFTGAVGPRAKSACRKEKEPVCADLLHPKREEVEI